MAYKRPCFTCVLSTVILTSLVIAASGVFLCARLLEKVSDSDGFLYVTVID